MQGLSWRRGVTAFVIALVGCGFPPPADVVDDPCLNATCECTVATQDLDCGAHEVCDDSGPGRICTCAPAYVDNGAGCVFDVAPRDPGFMDPTAWTTTGPGIRVNAAAVGTVDPGQLEIAANGFCAGSSVSQTFVMPPLSKSQPFKVAVTYGFDPNGNRGLNGLLSLDVGGRFFDKPGDNVPHTDTFCLGDKNYGRPNEIRIGPRNRPVVCPSTLPGSLNVDRIAVLPATVDECPMPGSIPNGDFEGTTGWMLLASADATAAIVNGVGETSSRAARLGTTSRCSQATMLGMLALPEQLANPAIEVYYTSAGADFDDRLVVSYDDKNISVLRPAALSRAHICLPRWALGTTGQLAFHLEPDAGNNGCGIARVQTWTLDNLKLVSDSTCGATVDNADGGFERITNRNGPTVGWGLLNDVVNDVKGATANIVEDRANARTGSGALRLGVSTGCVAGRAELSFLVPEPQGDAGPALKLFVNIGNNVHSATYVRVLPEFDLRLLQHGTYVQQTACLPRFLSNHLVTAQFRITMNDASCIANLPEEYAYIDDVEITTDPSCRNN